MQEQLDVLDELSTFLETRLADLHTLTVARVVAFDATGPWADVQPLLKRTYVQADGTRLVVDLPQVQRAPVWYPRGGGWSMTWPLAAGDLVLLVCAERSLDRWLASAEGAAVSPEDPRKHALTDAVVFAGLAPTRRAPVVSTTDLVLAREAVAGSTDPRAEVRLQPDGVVLLGEGATLGVARETDQVEISSATAPAFYTHLSQLAAAASTPGLTPPVVPPFTGPIVGRITSASARTRSA